MDPSLVTGLSAVMGSLAGASASVFTTWMTQHGQSARERSQLELRRREVLYAEFISEGFRLTADAFEHSLERADALVTLYSILGRIRLVSSDAVVTAAENCCRFLIDLYLNPNLSLEEIPMTIRDSDHPLNEFTAVCRTELSQYVVR
ncbi:MAG: hypothetical protein V4584_06245 [Verrucomicrobiota bacterium]